MLIQLKPAAGFLSGKNPTIDLDISDNKLHIWKYPSVVLFPVLIF